MREIILCLVFAASLLGQGRPLPTPFSTAGSTSGGTCGALSGDVTGTCAATVLSTIPSSVQDAITRLGTVVSGVWNGTVIAPTYGGSGANLSATGGTNQVVKQITTGAAFTVGTLASTNLSDTANILLTNTPSIVTQNGALSAPAFKLNGTWITGGDGTTTKPYLLAEPTGTTSTAWSVNGTGLGINGASGCTGNLADFQTGGTSLVRIKCDGGISSSAAGGWSGNSGSVSGLTYLTAANCSSAASPAVCAGAAAGSFVVAAAATTVVVNTSKVTANSQILVLFDSSLGTKLGSITCNTTEPALYGVTARVAATSFTLTSTAPVTNPACFSYFIVN